MMFLDAAIELPTDHAIAPRQREVASGEQGLEGYLGSGSVRLVKSREHIFSVGDARTHVYRVESGSVCLYKVLHDGRRQVLDFASAGDFIGLGCEAEHGFSAQALEPTRLKCLPVATLYRLAGRDPRIGIKLYESLSRQLAATHDHLFTVGQRSAVERVAGFLVAFARRNGHHGGSAPTIVLPMTRSDIADFLGLTIETVSRTLTKLRSAKIIDLEQCTLIKLLDTEKLRRLAAGELTT
jgi:CRP/FNR family transcriptional regulator